MITATGSAVGMMRGVPCVLGASLGMALVLLGTALGIGQVVVGYPRLIMLINGTGAAFLLYMAIKVAIAGAPARSAAGEPVGFFGATLFQWVNPKGWLVAVAATSTFFVRGTSGSVGEAVVFAALFMVVAVPSGLAWLVLGAGLRHLMRNARAARILNGAMGSALAASVVMMLW